MLSDRTGQIEKLEFARRAGGQVVTNVVCNRFHPFNFGMIAPGNHLDLDSLRAAPPARYRSVVRKFGICRGKPGRRTTLSFRTSAHTGVGISIEFRTTYRHTVCSNLPFPRIHSRKVVRLSGGLLHQSADWFAMTGNSPNSNLSRHRTIPSGWCCTQ